MRRHGRGKRVKPVEKFEAWCPCPSCAEFDCHALRAPKPKSWDLQKVMSDCSGWSDEAIMRYIKFLDKRDGSSEYAFEVMRTCKCGHEWGQV